MKRGPRHEAYLRHAETFRAVQEHYYNLLDEVSTALEESGLAELSGARFVVLGRAYRFQLLPAVNRSGSTIGKIELQNAEDSARPAPSHTVLYIDDGGSIGTSGDALTRSRSEDIEYVIGELFRPCFAYLGEFL